jgi:hypothetical protein
MNTKASPAPGRVWRAAALVLLALLAGCGDRMPSLQAWGQAAIELVQLFTRKPLPDPVQSKDGVAYIPIDDTAFLVPEKTWLRGYSTKLTDGSVGSITLHASVPDVQPWSPERNDAMYWKAGPGLSLRIVIEGNDAGTHRDNFHKVPGSRMSWAEFIEEPSDQAAQGLRRFRQSWGIYPEKDAEKDTRQFGAEFVERMRGHNGKPMMDTVYYEYIQNDRVQYFIHCDDGDGGLFHICHLSFPWARSLMVDITFARRDIKNIVAMADKVSERLREFEAAGQAHRAAMAAATPPVSPALTR